MHRLPRPRQRPEFGHAPLHVAVIRRRHFEFVCGKPHFAEIDYAVVTVDQEIDLRMRTPPGVDIGMNAADPQGLPDLIDVLEAKPLKALSFHILFRSSRSQ